MARTPGRPSPRVSVAAEIALGEGVGDLQTETALGVEVRWQPGPLVAHLHLHAARPLVEPHGDLTATVLERIRVELAEYEGDGRRDVTSHLNGLELRVGGRRAEPVAEHRRQPPHQVCEVDVALAARGRQVVHLGDREDAIDGVCERPLRVARARRAQPQQRRHRLQVVLDAVVDLLGHDPAHHAAPGLHGRRGLVGDRLQQRPLLAREAPPAGLGADERADAPRLPDQRHRHAAGRVDAVRRRRPPRAPRRPGPRARSAARPSPRSARPARARSSWRGPRSAAVCTIASSASSWYSDCETASEMRASASSSATRRCARS